MSLVSSALRNIGNRHYATTHWLYVGPDYPYRVSAHVSPGYPSTPAVAVGHDFPLEAALALLPGFTGAVVAAYIAEYLGPDQRLRDADYSNGYYRAYVDTFAPGTAPPWGEAPYDGPGTPGAGGNDPDEYVTLCLERVQDGGTGAVLTWPQSYSRANEEECCKAYLKHSTVHLRAQPSQGSYFAGYSGDLASMDALSSIHMDDNKLVLVAFSDQPPAQPDTEPPTLEILLPEEGASLSSPALIRAQASDNVGVESVEYQLNGGAWTPLPHASGDIYEAQPTLEADSYSLMVRARDAANNETVRGPRSFTVAPDAPPISTWTNFSEYTTGQQPNDWTKPWNQGLSAAVIDNAGAIGGKWLELTAPSNARMALAWDKIGAVADVEILALVSKGTNWADDDFRVHVRGGGGSGSEQGYYVFFSSVNINLARYVNGAATVLQTTAAQSTRHNGVAQWVRLRANGGTISYATWRANDAERSLLNSVIDTSIPTGWAGVGRFIAAGTVRVDYVSYALNGGTAPLPS